MGYHDVFGRCTSNGMREPMRSDREIWASRDPALKVTQDHSN